MRNAQRFQKCTIVFGSSPLCRAFGALAGYLQKPFRSIGEHAYLRRTIMGKYLIAWLLGVPAGLLVLIYVFTHLL